MLPEPRVIHADEVPEHEIRYPEPFDRPAHGFGRDLGAAAGTERLRLAERRIPPGHRSGFLHAHLGQEEALYVRSGEPLLVWGLPGGPEQRIPLRPGSWVAFPAGTGLAHCVENPSGAAGDAVVLLVGDRRAGDRLAYPSRPDFEAWRQAHQPEACWPDPAPPDAAVRGVPYRIETRHLVLRPFDPPDVWPLVRAMRENHERLRPWFPWARDLPSVDRQSSWIRERRAAYDTDQDYTLAVVRRDASFVGATGMHLRQEPGTVEIPYWIDHRYEGRGWVTEWVRGLTRVALQVLGAERCLIRCDIANHRSSAVPERLGYTLERTGAEPDPREEDTQVMEWWYLKATDLDGHPVSQAEVRAFDAAGRRLL